MRVMCVVCFRITVIFFAKTFRLPSVVPISFKKKENFTQLHTEDIYVTYGLVVLRANNNIFGDRDTDNIIITTNNIIRVLMI